VSRGRAASLAVVAVVAVLVAACANTAPTPVPPAVPGPPQPTSDSPTPATELRLPSTFRFAGPWDVRFSLPGRPTVREVYVASPTCRAGACTTNVRIQDFDGKVLGAGSFRFRDGAYVYRSSSSVSTSCSSGGKERVTTTTALRLVAFRPPGSAATAPRILGQRTIQTKPSAGSACPASTATYQAAGTATRFASTPTPRSEPRSAPRPEPKPAPAPLPAVPMYRGSWFGSGVRVTTYNVTGATRTAIVLSIGRRGPWSAWIHGRAEAYTKYDYVFRFGLASDASGSCRIVPTATPAIKTTATILLPRWVRPAGADRASVQWWIDRLRRDAVHERTHVRIAAAGAVRMNEALASSTCGDVNARLAAIARDVVRQQCEFDMREYGYASGLSLKACVAG
jgi:predicted secreted Zn-dependent protease